MPRGVHRVRERDLLHGLRRNEQLAAHRRERVRVPDERLLRRVRFDEREHLRLRAVPVPEVPDLPDERLSVRDLLRALPYPGEQLRVPRQRLPGRIQRARQQHLQLRPVLEPDLPRLQPDLLHRLRLVPRQLQIHAELCLREQLLQRLQRVEHFDLRLPSLSGAVQGLHLTDKLPAVHGSILRCQGQNDAALQLPERLLLGPADEPGLPG